MQGMVLLDGFIVTAIHQFLWHQAPLVLSCTALGKPSNPASFIQSVPAPISMDCFSAVNEEQAFYSFIQKY